MTTHRRVGQPQSPQCTSHTQNDPQIEQKPDMRVHIREHSARPSLSCPRSPRLSSADVMSCPRSCRRDPRDSNCIQSELLHPERNTQDAHCNELACASALHAVELERCRKGEHSSRSACRPVTDCAKQSSHATCPWQAPWRHVSPAQGLRHVPVAQMSC